MTDPIAQAEAAAKAAVAETKALTVTAAADAYKYWTALKGAAANPRWFLSSKFLVAVAVIVGFYVLAEKLPPHIAYSAAIVASAFLFSRAIENKSTNALAATRFVQLSAMVEDGRITVDQVAAVNKALGG